MSTNTVLTIGSSKPREFSEAHSTNYQIYINQFPNLQFFVTDAFLTSVNLPNFELPFHTGQLQMSDNKITYDPITFSFIVDEYFQSYVEIYNWMRGVADPIDEMRQPDKIIGPQDIYMKILDNNKNPIITFKYVRAIPIGLDQIVFDTQDELNSVLTSAVTFTFDYMDMENHYSELPNSL